MESIGTVWMWAGFAVVVVAMLAIDLFLVGGGKSHKVSAKEAGIWTVVWVSVAMLFAGVLWWYLDGTLGREAANARTLEFVTGYLIEKALAVDNVFVWLMLFSFFAVPPELQKRVLLYGVLGAIVMRTGMIFAGAWLISQFHWVLYVFGAFLLLSGVKMLFSREEHHPDLAQNPLLRFLRRHLRVTEELHDGHFFVRKRPEGATHHLLYATPLFLALVLIELADLVFAVDSVPAVFAITQDPFIVYTSNIFAILGLRSLYFALAALMHRFVYLKYALALVLIFIGGKIFLHGFIGKIPALLSLGVTFGLLAGGVLLSLLKTRNRPEQES